MFPIGAPHQEGYWRATGLLLASLVLVVGIVGAGVILSPPTHGPREAPVFSNGQMVKMAAFGHVGMVVGNRCPKKYRGETYPCTYSVRFSAIQSRTNTRIFGSDGPIDTSPVSLVHGIREYELKAMD